MPLPEETRLELAAIDAALAGDAVDPQYAELAELALLLADAKPELSPGGAAALDLRMAALGPEPRPRREARRRWFLRPACGAGLALALVVALLVFVIPHGGGSSSSSGYVNGAASSSGGASSSASSSSGSVSSSSAGRSAAPASAPPTPRSNGRRIVQTAQLSLRATNARIATVAQELFDVVGSERGIVKHSQISTGTSGYASFTLSIPTANLSATLNRLTELRYAQVASSSASSTDVNNQYLDDQRKLADATALRRSLLTQLAAATTTGAIDSLKHRITDAESTIATDEASVNRLQGQISLSAVSVTISAGDPVNPSSPQRRRTTASPWRGRPTTPSTCSRWRPASPSSLSRCSFP